MNPILTFAKNNGLLYIASGDFPYINLFEHAVYYRPYLVYPMVQAVSRSNLPKKIVERIVFRFFEMSQFSNHFRILAELYLISPDEIARNMTVPMEHALGVLCNPNMSDYTTNVFTKALDNDWEVCKSADEWEIC